MALDFDGVDDQVDHGHLTQLDGGTALTLSFWMKPDVLVDLDGLIGQWGTPNNQGIMPRMSGTAGNYDVFINGDRGRATGLLTVGVWDHHCIVYNGAGSGNTDRLKIYKNGIDQSLTYDVTIGASLLTSGNNFISGMVNSAFSDIKLALLKVWTVALTAAEVLLEMQSYRPQRTAGLILWAPYDSVADDYSGARNHGTVTGALYVGGPPVSFGAPD